MWISYSDSEVKVFHPLCEEALSKALKELRLDKEYKVIHHQYTGSLEMDFVIQHITTGKYVCVVEVKRTPSDVHSTRYQFQAMSYVQQNAGQTEKPYYILTNLECAYSFRYDVRKSKTFQQVLKPGFETIGRFENDTKERFSEKLSSYFKEKIKSFLADDFEYLVTLEQFVSYMESIKNDKKKWKSSLAILLYEYIRGSFTFINRKGLNDIRLFKNDISKICSEGARVNFKDIFSYSDDVFDNSLSVDADLLLNLFDFGEQNVSGDSIANILHQIASSGHEHDGEVSTDMELARIVLQLAFFVNGSLNENDLICDPAAGSGSLLSAAIDDFDIQPRQILANDWNEHLVELLSLRLGLKFANIVSKDNSPSIETKNIADLDKSFFDKVKIIVMNPPFVAGINCVERKEKFFRAINSITNETAKSNVGQMSLEAPFVELITHLVKKETTVACIFPKTHLTARGEEAKAIRRLLLEDFGLQLIFSYPGTEIFDEVVKDTCVLVGKVNKPSEKITVLSSYDNIPDLDILRFSKSLKENLSNEFAPMMPGLVGKKITKKELSVSIEDGWRTLNSEMTEAVDFVNKIFRDSYSFDTMESFGFTMKRGNAGNNGGSDLLFFDSKEEMYKKFEKRNLVLKAGMRNAKLDTFKINSGDSKFLDCAANDSKLIDEIIDFYMSLPQRESRQQRKQKSKAEWKKILERESKAEFPGNSVLIPRAIRSTGRIYFSEKPVFASTNLFVCTPEDKETAVLLASWMSTIFYQLICEVSSKDNEGMRKMEGADIGKTFVPDFSKLENAIYKKAVEVVRNITFLDLRNIQIRQIDRLWAETLFKDKAESILEEAARLLSFVVAKRNP